MDVREGSLKWIRVPKQEAFSCQKEQFHKYSLLKAYTAVISKECGIIDKVIKIDERDPSYRYIRTKEEFVTAFYLP